MRYSSKLKAFRLHYFKVKAFRIALATQVGVSPTEGLALDDPMVIDFAYVRAMREIRCCLRAASGEALATGDLELHHKIAVALITLEKEYLAPAPSEPSVSDM